MHSQKAVTVYFSSKQLLSFGFAEQYSALPPSHHPHDTVVTVEECRNLPVDVTQYGEYGDQKRIAYSTTPHIGR